jgi:hypothetical protein
LQSADNINVMYNVERAIVDLSKGKKGLWGANVITFSLLLNQILKIYDCFYLDFRCFVILVGLQRSMISLPKQYL